MSAPADIIEAIRTLVFHLPEGSQVQAIRAQGEKRATVLYTAPDGTRTRFVEEAGR